VDAGDTPAIRAWRSLVWIHGLIRRLSEPHLATYGFSGAQWGVLRTLVRMEAKGMGQPRMNELGEELLVQPPSLSATIDRMVRAGLVTRLEDPQDQRTRRVGLTSAGRKRLNDALADHRAWMESMMRELSPGEQRALDGMLERLGESLLDALEAPAGKGAGAAGRAGKARGAGGRAGRRA
jgi:MarR family 2-MHQ and catechol resistance regulon transcriptional repressor